MPNKRKTNNDFVDHGNHKTLYLLLAKILQNQVNIYNKPMIETLATCLCKQMLFCYLTDESLRHQRRQEKDNCLHTADFLVGCQKSGEKVENGPKKRAILSRNVSKYSRENTSTILKRRL